MILCTTDSLVLSKQTAMPIICEKLAGEDEIAPTIYVTPDVFKQACLLEERFGGEYEEIKEIIEAKDLEIMQGFYENVPAPMNMLAPFLGLVDGVNIQTYRDAFAVLHKMSMSIDFLSVISIPEQARKELKFTKSMIGDLDTMWDDLITRLDIAEFNVNEAQQNFISGLVKQILYDVMRENPPIVGVYGQPAGLVSYTADVQTGSVPEDEKPEIEDPLNDKLPDDFWDNILAEADAQFEEEEKQREAKEKKEEKKDYTTESSKVTQTMVAESSNEDTVEAGTEEVGMTKVMTDFLKRSKTTEG